MADDLTVDALIDEAEETRRVGPNERWFAEHPKAAAVLAKALADPKGKSAKAIVQVFRRYYPDCPTGDPQGIKRALGKLGL